MSSNNTSYMTRLAVLLAVSIIFGFVESFLIAPIPFPGVKFGLANTIGLILLYLYSYKEYIAISILRVIFVALLTTGLGSGFLISLGGMTFSIIAVLYFRFVFRPSIYGLSMISAIFHGIGQILIVSFLYKTIFMVAYLPVLLITGLITGYLIALISAMALQRIRILKPRREV